MVTAKRARSAEFRWESGREAPLHSHGHSEAPISLSRSNSKVRRESKLPVPGQTLGKSGSGAMRPTHDPSRNGSARWKAGMASARWKGDLSA